jgi:hypothetical protein
MKKFRTADISLVDTNTMIINHVGDDGDEVTEKFDIDDPMCPLTFRCYMQKNKIESCNCHMEEDSEWQEKTMDKFFASAEELFTIGDLKIESGYLN